MATLSDCGDLRLLLPEFLTDVECEIREVSPFLASPTHAGLFWQADARQFLLEIPEVGRYLTTDGGRIAVEPAQAAPTDRVARVLRMTPLAVLLHQRGTLALHAAAVSRDGVAVLLAGDSATGKSTVAAELLARGWRFLADELAVVEPSESGSMQVRPIWPEVVLWRDSMKRMSMTGLPVHGNEMGWPRAASVAEKFGTSARMGMICCLEVGAAAGSVEIGELQGLSKYLWPRKHAYGHRLAGVYLHHSEHLSRVLELSSRVPAFRIVRPSANWTVQTVADHVERSFWQAGNG